MLSRTFAFALSLFFFQVGIQAKAEPNYPTTVDTEVKNLFGSSASFTASCNGCHGSSYNISNSGTGFGKDILSQATTLGYSPTSLTNAQMNAILKNLAGRDSDGDGATNQQEFLAGTNPGDATSKPAPVCTRATPTVALSPTSASGAPGATLTYSLSIKNNDSAACSNSTFALTSTASTGLSVGLAMQSVVLAPAQSSSVSVAVLSSSSLTTSSSLSFTLTARNSAATTYMASVMGTYNVMVSASCVRAAPAVVISPSTQSAAAGSTLNYSVSIKNNDSSVCAPETIALAFVSSSSLTGQLTTNSVSLAPGASANAQAAVTSIPNAAPATLSFMISAAGSMSSSASATYVIKAATDTMPPTAPTGVTSTAIKHAYQISWMPSKDDVAVAKYRVYLDGNLRAETTDVSQTIRVHHGPHEVTVSAVDAAGNESLMSAPISVGN